MATFACSFFLATVNHISTLFTGSTIAQSVSHIRCQPLNLIISFNPQFFFTYVAEQNKGYYSIMNEKNFRTIFKIDFE